MTSTDTRSLETEAESLKGSDVPLPKVLRRFWIGSVVAFALTLLVSYLEFRAGMVWDRWEPIETPLFADLLQNAPTFRLLHTAEFFSPTNSLPVSYPPFGAIQLGVMNSFRHPVMLFVAVALTALGVAVWGIRRELLGYGISKPTATLLPITLALMSFPVERLILQGNIELFLWIFAAAGTWAYLRNRDDAAAVLWVLAAASKLYPVVLLVLLLPRRKFRAFAIGVFLFIAISALSMAYLGPSLAVAWTGSLKNVFGYQHLRAAEWSMHDLHANHSFFLLVKVVAMIAGVSMAMPTKPYYLCGGLIFAAVFFGRLRRMPVANQLLAVSVFMLSFPAISYFHPLVNLYAPLMVLFFLAIRADRAGVQIPGLSTAILLFIPLFVSFQLFTFTTVFLFCGIVQAVVLLMLFLYAVQYPFAEPGSRDGGRRGRQIEAGG